MKSTIDSFTINLLDKLKELKLAESLISEQDINYLHETFESSSEEEEEYEHHEQTSLNSWNN